MLNYTISVVDIAIELLLLFNKRIYSYCLLFKRELICISSDSSQFGSIIAGITYFAGYELSTFSFELSNPSFS